MPWDLAVGVLVSPLPLFPDLSVGDATALAVFAAFGGVSLFLLHGGGRLRIGQIAAMGAVGAVAFGYLLGLGLSTGGAW